jgi:hypothetical protein
MSFDEVWKDFLPDVAIVADDSDGGSHLMLMEYEDEYEIWISSRGASLYHAITRRASTRRAIKKGSDGRPCQ